MDKINAFVRYVEKCDSESIAFDTDACANNICLEEFRIGIEQRRNNGTVSEADAWGFLLMCVNGRYKFKSKTQAKLVYKATASVLNHLKVDLDEYCDGTTYKGLLDSYKRRIMYYDLSQTAKKKMDTAGDLKYFLKDLEATYICIYLDDVLFFFDDPERSDDEIDPCRHEIHTLLSDLITKYPTFKDEYNNKNSLNMTLRLFDDEDARTIERGIEQLLKYVDKYGTDRMIANYVD